MIGNNSTNACAQMFAKKENQAKKSMGSHSVLVAAMTSRASFPRSAGLTNKFDH
jgi:hypothetical protein